MYTFGFVDVQISLCAHVCFCTCVNVRVCAGLKRVRVHVCTCTKRTNGEGHRNDSLGIVWQVIVVPDDACVHGYPPVRSLVRLPGCLLVSALPIQSLPYVRLGDGG